MSKLHLSVSSTDEVDELAEGIEISSGDVASFELDDQEAMSLYHFIRQCLLLENKITIEVTGNEGQLVNLDNQVNHPDRCIHGKIEVKEAYIKNRSEGSDQDD